MKRRKSALIGYPALCCLLVNMYLPLRSAPWLLAVLVPLYLYTLLFAGVFGLKTESKRLRLCHHGAVLLLGFEISTLAAVIYHIALAFITLPGDPWTLVWSLVLCVCLEYILFWAGILTVYFTSTQLGLKLRIIGLICGMIPVANLIALNFILKTVLREVRTECEKEALNRGRRAERICQTRYPILMVHGVFFRDSQYFNYWGRIPKELERNG